MSIGKISELDGIFYVKRFQDSNVVRLIKHDEVYKNDRVFGCVSNRYMNCVFIDFDTGVEAVLFGNEEYIINEYLYI
jgi:hypothetical protein